MVPAVTRRARQVISLIRYLRELCVSCGRIPTPAPIAVFPLPRSHVVAVAGGWPLRDKEEVINQIINQSINQSDVYVDVR